MLPPSVRWHPAPGVAVRAAALAGDVVTDGDLRWTSRTRTALDLIRRGPLDDAVILLDRPVHADVVELGTVRAAAAALPRCRGSRQAREAALADGLWHGEPQQVGPDRERLNRLLAAALTA